MRRPKRAIVVKGISRRRGSSQGAPAVRASRDACVFRSALLVTNEEMRRGGNTVAGTGGGWRLLHD